MANIKIAVTNEFKGLTSQQVKNAVDALQIQVTRDFAPIWGKDADLIYQPGQSVPAGYWQIVILENTDQAGALGYHDLTKEGLPLSKVFAGTDLKFGYSWTVTMSHELLEMLGDPDINLTALKETKKKQGVLYAYENCDACESEDYCYDINGVKVSDFVYPSWFETFHHQGTKFDFGGHITQAFELLPGGYIGVYDVKSGNGWQQLYPENQKITLSMRAHIGSRRERRKIPRDEWLKSTF